MALVRALDLLRIALIVGFAVAPPAFALLVWLSFFGGYPLMLSIVYLPWVAAATCALAVVAGGLWLRTRRRFDASLALAGTAIGAAAVATTSWARAHWLD